MRVLSVLKVFVECGHTKVWCKVCRQEMPVTRKGISGWIRGHEVCQAGHDINMETARKMYKPHGGTS